MKKIAQLLALSIAAASLTACGMGPMGADLKLSTGSSYNAEATITIKKSFKQIHQAIFAKIDVNSDKVIDEYEAGPNIKLADFTKIDKNHDGKISYAQFMSYATDDGFFGGTDNADKFLKRIRNGLSSAFNSLDKDRSLLLEKKELSATAVKKLKLGFTHDNLNVTVSITSFSADEITAADKTGDGNLSQAEFEDLYINKVVSILTPAAPAPAPVDPAPVDPVASDSVVPAV